MVAVVTIYIAQVYFNSKYKKLEVFSLLQAF